MSIYFDDISTKKRNRFKAISYLLVLQQRAEHQSKFQLQTVGVDTYLNNQKLILLWTWRRRRKIYSYAVHQFLITMKQTVMILTRAEYSLFSATHSVNNVWFFFLVRNFIISLNTIVINLPNLHKRTGTRNIHALQLGIQNVNGTHKIRIIAQQ